MQHLGRTCPIATGYNTFTPGPDTIATGPNKLTTGLDMYTAGPNRPNAFETGPDTFTTGPELDGVGQCAALLAQQLPGCKTSRLHTLSRHHSASTLCSPHTIAQDLESLGASRDRALQGAEERVQQLQEQLAELQEQAAPAADAVAAPKEEGTGAQEQLQAQVQQLQVRRGAAVAREPWADPSQCGLKACSLLMPVVGPGPALKCSTRHANAHTRFAGGLQPARCMLVQVNGRTQGPMFVCM